MMKLSACWIVKNEEANIVRSISSVANIVDELLVIDTGSTDNTVKLAEEAGAKILYFEWIGDFAAARNFALSQVSGDVTFFLDADEWFATPLPDNARAIIEKYFGDSPELDAIQLVICNLNSQGAIKTKGIASRILRRRASLGFQKMVHEQFLRLDGTDTITICIQDWPLDHCGYVEEILSSKMKRNIALLEDAAVIATDPIERCMLRCYLVRENFQEHEMASAMKNLRYALEEPEMLRRLCTHYQHGIAPLFYIMMVAASESRKGVSRREIQNKVVNAFKRNIKDYPGVAAIDLFYDVLFDPKEDLLLEKIGPTLEASRKIPESQISYYFEAEMAINTAAASAAFRRGRLREAMDFAIDSFKNTQSKSPESLHVLLSCLRGQPVAEIILFLNSQFDLKNPQKLEYLSGATRLHGFRDVHAYYLDKLIKAELATVVDYLYLLVLYGKYEDMIDRAKERLDKNDSDTVVKMIFVAVICAKDLRLYNENKDLLANYTNILDSFFEERAIENPTDADFSILLNAYSFVALAAGLPRADEFTLIFSRDQGLMTYQIRAKYCIDNGLFEDILAQPMHDTENFTNNNYLIQALTMAGRLDEAFEKTKKLCEIGNIDRRLMQYLLAIADRAKGELKQKAKALYDIYMPAFDRLIDLSDFVMVGYYSEDNDKKKCKILKTITPAQFKKKIAEDAAIPKINELVEVSEKAAALYEEKSVLAMAVECLRFALAHGSNESENYKKLADLFSQIGNQQLAGELRKRI